MPPHSAPAMAESYETASPDPEERAGDLDAVYTAEADDLEWDEDQEEEALPEPEEQESLDDLPWEAPSEEEVAASEAVTPVPWSELPDEDAVDDEAPAAFAEEAEAGLPSEPADESPSLPPTTDFATLQEPEDALPYGVGDALPAEEPPMTTDSAPCDADTVIPQVHVETLVVADVSDSLVDEEAALPDDLPEAEIPEEVEAAEAEPADAHDAEANGFDMAARVAQDLPEVEPAPVPEPAPSTAVEPVAAEPAEEAPPKRKKFLGLF